MVTDYRSAKIIPFYYLVSVALTSLGTGTQTLIMQADSEFELHQFAAATDQDGATTTAFIVNAFTCQITDLSTGRQLMSAKIDQRILCAPANPYYKMFRPVIFPAQANLLFDFTNNIAGTTNIHFCLCGYKLLM